MIRKEFKKETLATLDIMIANAEKGPSGFWVDDFEGCGNPYIFPEFEDGLKKGKLVQKKHYLCAWNTAVLFGEGHGNIHTGCYCKCQYKNVGFIQNNYVEKPTFLFCIFSLLSSVKCCI